MKVFKILVLLASVYLLGGCRGCNLENEINNNQADPKKLWVGFSGTDIAVEIEQQLTAGACNFPNNSMGDVRINVFTATTDANGNLILEQSPYYTVDEEDVEFPAGNPQGATVLFELNVPEVGAYGLQIEIRPDQCSDCCKDKDFTAGQNDSPNPDPRCDGDQANNLCPTGKPTLMGTKIFTSQTRPKQNSQQLPYNPVPELVVGRCRSCNSCPTVPCN